ncbi:MAG: Stp1/IreP family PP2C-type Ser/Thr phosphatase [Capsulimonas sp.]|uniref:Stp1/IreP family PP2C-type Ser/Thr phosphatase n=1 Tax=Capsulimonas sp. TaxID=2494211 RepID=UPI003262DB30
MQDYMAAQEKTVQFSRDDMNEGWAELGRTPRVLATVKLGAKTDLGRVRENNEDKFDFYEPEDPAVLASKGSFYGVADGMGGHSAGQIACELALKIVIRSYYSTPSPDTHSNMRRAIEEANGLIYDTAQMITERNGMGTTLTCAIIREDMITVAQVGDSRCYLIRDGEIGQITEDHSWVAEQVRIGAMTLEEAQASPFRNIITRSIGTASTIESDITTHAMQEGDIFVLCSDGLSGHLEASDIQRIALEHSPSIAAMRLVEEANERGGRDNITAVVLSIREIKPFVEETEEAAAAGDGAKQDKRAWGRRK